MSERGMKRRVLMAWRLERERAPSEDANERAEKSGSDLRHYEAAISYICHELRNPLHGIRGSLDALIAGRVGEVGAACVGGAAVQVVRDSE